MFVRLGQHHSLVQYLPMASVDGDASDNDGNDAVALEHGVAHGVLVFGDEINTED